MQIRSALSPTILIASSVWLSACDNLGLLDVLEHWHPVDPTADAAAPFADVLELNGMAQPGMGLAAGSSRDCLLDSRGDIDCWGWDEYGQVQSFQGDGTELHREGPTPVQGLTEIAAVIAGERQTCALRADGTAACWGNDSFGQLGDGMASEIQPAPSEVAQLDHALALAVAAAHSCALRADGQVLCWGNNRDGQLDTDAAALQPLPRLVPRVVHARGISVGTQFSCALIQDGTVTCWGRLPGGEDIAGPTPVSGIRDATYVTAGETHACALLSDQTVMCWGLDTSGQLGAGSSSARSATPVRVALLTDVVSSAFAASRVRPVHFAPLAAANVRATQTPRLLPPVVRLSPERMSALSQRRVDC